MQNKTKFTERDIIINDMLSRNGKATENMHLSIAKVKKQKKQEGLKPSFVPDRRKQIQNQQKTIVNAKHNMIFYHFLDCIRDRRTF